jgi:hypothetical protein
MVAPIPLLDHAFAAGHRQASRSSRDQLSRGPGLADQSHADAALRASDREKAKRVAPSIGHDGSRQIFIFPIRVGFYLKEREITPDIHAGEARFGLRHRLLLRITPLTEDKAMERDRYHSETNELNGSF